MTTAPIVRKPKLHFDTEANPNHVTFDDGKESRRNIPWSQYTEARWEYAEPDIIFIEIGEWVVTLQGHNLGPLFLAIEMCTLVRVRAQPNLGQDRERESDTFVTELRFTKPPAGGIGEKRCRQIELDLGD